jgi:hypothetical protein
LHNEDQLEASEPHGKESFVLRTTASKAVYDEMTVDEQAAVDRKAGEAAQDPIPPDIQHK